MHDYILSLMRRGRVSGLSIATVRGDRIEEVAAFGVRNAETKEPVEKQTVFEAASLSKPVFSYAVLQLVDAGELELDRPLSELAPRIVPDDPASAPITARHVLAHTTGLPNWRRDEYPLRTHFTPGTRFSYSGEGFAYLQSVLERITGEDLDGLMKRLVFDPLGMRDSSYLWQARFADNFAASHDEASQPLPKFKPAVANAAYSLHTTAPDYGRFLMATLDGSRLTRGTALRWLTPQLSVPKERFECLDPSPPEIDREVSWGLGWGLEPGAGRFFHWGSNFGSQAFGLGSRADRKAVVIFTNADNGLSIAPDIVGGIMPGEYPSFSWLGLLRKR